MRKTENDTSTRQEAKNQGISPRSGERVKTQRTKRVLVLDWKFERRNAKKTLHLPKPQTEEMRVTETLE